MRRLLVTFFTAVVAIVTIVAVTSCEQAADTSDNEKTDAAENAKKEPFRPYEYNEVPSLKKLIFSDGFTKYVTKQPYLLGYSYEGDYVATVVYDKQKEGFLVGITHTVRNQVVYEGFVPNKEQLTSGDQVSIDLLSTAQESLDMGYRIKVPPVHTMQQQPIFEQQGEGGSVYQFQIEAKKDDTFRIVVSDEEEQRWVVVNDPAPLEKGRHIADQYMLAIHPQIADRVNIMVYTTKKGEPVTPYVYTVNTALLKANTSEQRVEKTLKEWLDHPAIVYRYPSSANSLSLLAVDGEAKPVSDGSPLYSGRVKQFVLLDQKGELVVRADRGGIFNKKKDTLSGKLTDGQYEVVLVPSSVPGEAELLVVDVFDGKEQLTQTLQWRWDGEKRTFQLIK